MVVVALLSGRPISFTLQRFLINFLHGSELWCSKVELINPEKHAEAEH
jgi:hypothetical protein